MVQPLELKTFEQEAAEMNASSGYGGSEHQPQEAGLPKDVTGNRTAGTTYQNTSGKKKRVTVTVVGPSTGVLNDCIGKVEAVNPPTVVISRQRINTTAGVNLSHMLLIIFEVPKDWYYLVEIPSGASINQWSEWDE